MENKGKSVMNNTSNNSTSKKWPPIWLANMMEFRFTKPEANPTQTTDPSGLPFLNPPRDGKKCLVLDVDLTLCNMRHNVFFERPYLHEFLTTAYQSYDIIIWSATNMTILRWKLKMLGMLYHRDYKLTLLIDNTATEVFKCKPLEIIWKQCPQFYTSKNTIMFDDQAANFAMNPQNGLVIKPFHYVFMSCVPDHELRGLADYLVSIAPLDDFSKLDHQQWRDYLTQMKVVGN